MTTRYVGTGTDPIQFIDAMLWWPWAVSHGVNPFVDHWLWSPTGTDLLWITSVPAISLVLSPITLIFGPVVAYNMAMLIGPVLNALSMFLLLSHWVNKYWWKVFGGYIFGFSSYEIGETLGHLHLTWTFVIPLVVLWAFKIYGVDPTSHIPKRYPLVISLLLVFQFFVSTEVLTSLILFGSLFILLIFLADQHNARLLRLIKVLAVSVIGFLLAISPFVFYMLRHPYYLKPPNSPVMFSASLLNYIIPTQLTLGGQYFTYISNQFLGNLSENDAYLGIPLILLTLFSFFRPWASWRLKSSLAALLMTIVILSLGPALHLSGNLGVRMPEDLFLRLPELKDLLPVRFTLYVSFLAAVIVTTASNHFASFRWPKLLTLTACLVVLTLLPNIAMERNLMASQLTIPKFFSIPAQYRNYLPHNSTIMIFPYGDQGNALAMQVAADNWFRLANGYWGYPPPLYRHIPIVHQLFFSTTIPRSIAAKIKKKVNRKTNKQIKMR